MMSTFSTTWKVVSVSYVGNKGTHVFPNHQAPDANQIGLVVGSNRFNGPRIASRHSQTPVRKIRLDPGHQLLQR
jgi:hypothetical protein